MTRMIEYQKAGCSRCCLLVIVVEIGEQLFWLNLLLRFVLTLLSNFSNFYSIRMTMKFCDNVPPINCSLDL